MNIYDKNPQVPTENPTGNEKIVNPTLFIVKTLPAGTFLSNAIQRTDGSIPEAPTNQTPPDYSRFGPKVEAYMRVVADVDRSVPPRRRVSFWRQLLGAESETQDKYNQRYNEQLGAGLARAGLDPNLRIHIDNTRHQ